MWISNLVRKVLELKDEELKAFFMRASTGEKWSVQDAGSRTGQAEVKGSQSP